MSEPILIIGSSVRAAAMSARKAGFEPIAIDRFADADLRAICQQFRRYDELGQVPMLARDLPAADWVYTGPLENHPRLIEQVASDRVLLGCRGSALRQVREPRLLAEALHETGLQAPRLKASNDGPLTGNWLRKPRNAAGGYGIERAMVRQSDAVDEVAYFQELISGRSIGATFVAARGRSVLAGATDQLFGTQWGGTREFQYVGSVGPSVLSADNVKQLSKIGDCIAASFAIEGLFGVDAIINEEGVWPVEVNPRYTASVEIVERAFHIATLNWHVAACRRGELPAAASPSGSNAVVELHGKAVVYATRELIVDARLEQMLQRKNQGATEPIVADIPIAGTRIEEGDPIATVFARGNTSSEVEERLRTEMARLTLLCVHGD